METGLKELYERQLSMLCGKANKSYKNSLVKLLQEDGLNEESEAEVLRKVLIPLACFTFCCMKVHPVFQGFYSCVRRSSRIVLG